jgi:hypothetical protein
MKKAQSAMEYLMTYGWAILIVIIVAAALYALGVFNPQTYVGSAATGFSNLGAPDEYAFAGTSNTFTLVLKNAKTGTMITVNNVTVDCNAGSPVESTQTAAATVDIATDGTSTFTVNCNDDLSAGDTYNYDVTIRYIPFGKTLEVVDQGRVTGVAQ